VCSSGHSYGGSSYRVSWTAKGGAGSFVVSLHSAPGANPYFTFMGAPGSDMVLVNEAPPNPSSGEAILNANGWDYTLEIKAPNLTWTITFTPI
jgi:hypothetical protein